MDIARARSTADLAVLVPYILGFHPRSSIVVLGFRGRRLGLTQRLDLVDDPDAARAVARQMIGHALDDGADRVTAIGFEEDEGGSRPLRRALVAAGVVAGVTVTTAVVREGRLYDPHETSGASREGGTALPDPSSVPAVALLVAEGRAPAEGRECLRRRIDPGVHPDAATVEEALVDLVADRLGVDDPGEVDRVDASMLRPGGGTSTWAMTWAAALDGSSLSPPGIAELVLSLRDVAWRDALLAVLGPWSKHFGDFAELPLDDALEAVRGLPWAARAGCDGPCGGGCPCGGPVIGSIAGPCAPVTGDGPEDEVVREGACPDEVLDRLGEILHRVAREDAAPLLTVVGSLAWWCGEGALASIALEEALEIEPGYRLAQLLDQLVQHGIRVRPRAA